MKHTVLMLSFATVLGSVISYPVLAAPTEIKLDEAQSQFFRQSFDECKPELLTAIQPQLSQAGLVFAPIPSKIAKPLQQYQSHLIFKADKKFTTMDEEGDNVVSTKVYDSNGVLINYALEKFTPSIVLADGAKIAGIKIYANDEAFEYKIYFRNPSDARTFNKKLKVHRELVIQGLASFTCSKISSR